MMRVKGQPYWLNMTLAGSYRNEKEKKSRKQYTLIEAYEMHIIPAMEAIAREKSEGGKYRVVFHEQEDCAGCHNNAIYNRWKEFEFGKRNWIRRNQSPQSPLFNVNDHFYFRKLSKEISAIQSLTYGTRVMKNKEILTVVDKVWKDKTDSVAISRGWMSHYQIMAATLEMNGDNAYLHNKGGLDFGVRVSYHANEDNTGVNRIDEPATEESPAEIIANDRVKKGLKYDIPSILDLKHGHLTDEEKEFFRAELDFTSMNDDIMEFW